MRTQVIAYGIVFALIAVSVARAEDATAAAQTQPAAEQGEPLAVTVVSVTGRAQKLVATDGKQTWAPLEAGQVLGERTIIRTGMRTKVVLRFADSGAVTIKSATKIGIGEFRKQAGTVRTRLGLKYGAIRASVDSTRAPNDWSVSTPTATLSVRGSGADFAWLVDSGTRVQSHQGSWKLKFSPLVQQTLLAGESGGGGDPTPYFAVLKRIQTLQMLDAFGGLSDPEAVFLSTNGSGLGLAGFQGINFGSQILPDGTPTPSGGSGRDEGSP